MKIYGSHLFINMRFCLIFLCLKEYFKRRVRRDATQRTQKRGLLVLTHGGAERRKYPFPAFKKKVSLESNYKRCIKAF